MKIYKDINNGLEGLSTRCGKIVEQNCLWCFLIKTASPIKLAVSQSTGCNSWPMKNAVFLGHNYELYSPFLALYLCWVWLAWFIILSLVIAVIASHLTFDWMYRLYKLQSKLGVLANWRNLRLRRDWLLHVRKPQLMTKSPWSWEMLTRYSS